ncbi:hypothetical protein CRUP_028042, partial [Coryphaenoides rupestris]
EYQSLYHSVVDPLLVTTSGTPHKYTPKLGLRIKEHLWRALYFIMDVSDEPKCSPPAKKRHRR